VRATVDGMWLLPLALATTLLAPGSTPLDTARAYFEAILRGESDRALVLVYEPSQADRWVVEASAARERGLSHLEELARSRFGERGDLGVAAHRRRVLQAIVLAKVEVQGDRAEVRPEGERPLRLRRVAGAWKVLSPAERLTGEERGALSRALEKTQAVAEDLAARIRSGALRSAREARAALSKVLGQDREDGVPL